MQRFERALRLALGILIAAAATVVPAGGWLMWAVVAAAATLALTAFVGFCPACALFGRRLVRGRP